MLFREVKRVLQQPASYNAQNSNLHRGQKCSRLKNAKTSKMHRAQNCNRAQTAQSWIILMSPTLLTKVAEIVLLYVWPVFEKKNVSSTLLTKIAEKY